MAQHDFVPAWLNFSTPQPAKSPAASFDRHGEHLPRGDGKPSVSRRRHNSSDGFFNNDPLRARQVRAPDSSLRDRVTARHRPRLLSSAPPLSAQEAWPVETCCIWDVLYGSFLV
ncbi:hypothetical protein ANANG_G00077390 [Anguilla anguilla]|uniref:Uncharacterized protein n=1 Tax=Anguilla anguilla TaxID=7936 RepID=A0A9D3S0D5_ANGAN|nr:hypothetical protein ANANG_G00077390 [Anguilla anguilla]